MLRPDDVFDYSPALEAVVCDGQRYRRAEDGGVVEEVLDQRRAAVFEIGRMMG